MKMTIGKVLPWVIVGVLMYLLVVPSNNKEEVIKIPQESNTIEATDIKPVVKWDTIRVHDTIVKVVKKKNPVNQNLLKQYKEAKDSLSQMKLYKEAITIRDYEETYEDDNQKVKVSSKVIGSLLSQKIKYDILPKEITYKNPTEGLYVGVGGRLSYKNLELPTLSTDLSLVKNKTIYTLGVGMDETILVGIKKKLF